MEPEEIRDLFPRTRTLQPPPSMTSDLQPLPSNLLKCLHPSKVKWVVLNCWLAKPAAKIFSGKLLMVVLRPCWVTWPLPASERYFPSPRALKAVCGSSTQSDCKLHLGQVLIFFRIPPPPLAWHHIWLHKYLNKLESMKENESCRLISSVYAYVEIVLQASQYSWKL